MHDCKYFSLALDESTDVMDVSQLLIFTRTIDSSYEVHEELLKLVSLHDTTKGTDIFNAVNSVASAYGGFKLSAVVTDGAPAMQGRHTGFAGLLQQSGVNCPILHCIIHQVSNLILGYCLTLQDKNRLILTVKCNLHVSLQEALCAKALNFSHVMDLVTKVTNIISHRRFIAFLDEVDATYGDLQMHTEIRWMSRGKCLERFFCDMLRNSSVFGGQCSW